MLKAYKLKPQYEGKLIGATCVGGPDGRMLNILETLNENDGVITTEDNVQQSIFRSLYGADGLLMEEFDIDEDGNLVESGTITPTLPQPESAVPNIPAINTPGEEPVHGQGGYDDLGKEELREVAVSRGLDFKGNVSKADLVKMLEDTDNQAIAPDQSDADQSSPTAGE